MGNGLCAEGQRSCRQHRCPPFIFNTVGAPSFAFCAKGGCHGECCGDSGEIQRSTDWAYSKQKGAFACNTNKCNAFVGDVTKEPGGYPIRIC
jgi:hypothetical protein